MSINNTSSKLAIIGMLCFGISACGGSSSDSDTSDSSGDTSITNSAPVVDAGADQTIDAGSVVSISATITDDDGDEVTIAWSQLSGTSVTLADTSSAEISFTAPSVTADETVILQISADDGTNAAVTDDISITILAADDGSDDDSDEDSNDSVDSDTSAWIINNDTTSTFIQDSTAILEDVQSAEVVTIVEDNVDVEYVYVQASGIPRYEITMTQTQVDELNARPQASSDFTSGVTSAQAGEVISFGENIGYNSSNLNCNDTGGYGYWPPGPGCPTNQEVETYFAVSPTPLDDSSDDCETGLGTIGLMVNGTSIFNWGDGHSYGDDVWYNLAPVAEQYDVDICGGHAADGNYHHHFYTSCLADLLSDDGSQHSPIYGFSGDGYPLYGPYESANVLAVSGWQTRDYGASTSEGGCATEGERTCILVDSYDLSQGVTTVTSGPDIDSEVTTLSGNTLVASNGYYLEDYYYAGVEVSGAQLDEHNGHDTNDGKGYHYHITLTEDENNKLIPSFPYQIGPSFKGEIPSNSIAQCDGGMGGMPPM